jgi:hypothetical protein
LEGGLILRISKGKLIIFLLVVLLFIFQEAPAFSAVNIGINLSETTFSPNGDGFHDTNTVWFNIDSDAYVTVRVLNPSGKVLYNLFKGQLSAGPHAFIWGGTSRWNGGYKIPNGKYQMQVVATDNSGTTWNQEDFYLISSLIGPGGIENGAITRDKIAFGAVDNSRIADDAITSEKIKDGEVKAQDIADGAITTSKLGDGSVTSNKIADGGISTADIKDGAITNTKLASNAIGSSAIADNSVGNSKIAANAVDSSKIADGSIVNSDISPTAAIDPTKINGTAWTSTNDGAGSGLDADTLDGHDAGWFIQNDNNQVDNADIANGSLSASKINGTAWTSTNDGAGSGLDADLLDGLNSSDFASSTHNHDAAYVNDNANEVDNNDIADGSLNPAKINGTAWTSTNDGAGSGLDADLLDGNDSSAFIKGPAANFRIESGVTTLSTSAAGYVNKTINFTSSFSSGPLVFTSLAALTDPNAQVTNLTGISTSASTGTVSFLVNTPGAAGSFAYVVWLAVGN